MKAAAGSSLSSPIVFEQFAGLNTLSARAGIKNDECSWLDGFMPVGPNTIRALPGAGSAVYTAPSGLTISCYYFGNIGPSPIAIVFLSDGSIVQVNTSTNASKQIAAAGTMTEISSAACGISQWGSQYIIIVGKQGGSGDGYFIWDGTTFYTAGMTVPGFSVAVPSGLRGNACETYSGRVWVADGNTIHFTAPDSITDFSTSDGGGSFTSTDSFLRVGYTQPRQTNGFLYLIGDSSVNYISGVATSGSPPTTTFTNQNADPEIGTPYPATVQVFSRNIIFANAFGIHVSYGGAVSKISDLLNGIYNTVPNFGGLTPSSAKAIIFGQKCYMLLLPVIDAITGQQVNKLLMWNGKHWWTSQQDVSLVFIECQEFNSILTAWGTDGTSIYELFANPSANFTKTVQSRLYAGPEGYQTVKASSRFWGVAYYHDPNSPDLTVTLDSESGSSTLTINPAPNEVPITNAAGAAVTIKNASGADVAVVSSGPSILAGVSVLPAEAITQNGALLGLTISTNSPDVVLVSTEFSAEFYIYRG